MIKKIFFYLCCIWWPVNNSEIYGYFLTMLYAESSPPFPLLSFVFPEGKGRPNRDTALKPPLPRATTLCNCHFLNIECPERGGREERRRNDECCWKEAEKIVFPRWKDDECCCSFVRWRLNGHKLVSLKKSFFFRFEKSFLSKHTSKGRHTFWERNCEPTTNIFFKSTFSS